VQLGQARAEIVIDPGPVLRRDIGQGRVHQDAARHVVHHIEVGADDARVLAEDAGVGHGHVRILQRAHGGVFAVDLVGGGKQDAGRFLPQDVTLEVAAVARDQKEGRVRGATLELVNLQPLAEVLDTLVQIPVERGDVEAMGRRDLADW
jgi:hypothetical protein